MPGAVEIEHVSKSYDSLQAVVDVSLQVPTGSTLGLIGPNGAGKTTLLRMISTLALPDEGRIRIAGHSVTTHGRRVRSVLGFMPAEFGCPRDLTIGEYLEYFACAHGVTAADRPRRIREVCELTDLAGREAVMVSSLSTGNKQRLLLAKTLLHDPEVLILDEPASGLDPRARNELRTIIRTLAELGKSVIISSHILPDIEDISDRIAIMEAGRLVVDGDLATLRNRQAPSESLIRLRVAAGQTAKAVAAIESLDETETCVVADQTLRITGRFTDSNCILALLCREEIHVTFFAENETSLEDIFMKSTAGKVT